MWTYSQTHGTMADANGEVIGTGYSGHETGKNQPLAQTFHAIGPIPQGAWSIGPADTHPGLGPVVMALTPMPDTNAFGRSGFYIHGDSILHRGDASHGCIVLDHATRVAISLSDDKDLNVVL